MSRHASHFYWQGWHLLLHCGFVCIVSCSFFCLLCHCAPTGPPDAEEDERGLRKAAATSDSASPEEDAKDFDCACASSRTCFQRVFGKSTWSIPISCSPASVPLAVTLHYLHTVTARFGAACAAHPVPNQCPSQCPSQCPTTNNGVCSFHALER